MIVQRYQFVILILKTFFDISVIIKQESAVFMEIRENELVSVSLDIGRYKGGRSYTVVGYECMLLYKFEILIKYIKQAVTLITGKPLMICRTKDQTVYTGYVTQRYIAKNFLFEEGPIQGIDFY